MTATPLPPSVLSLIQAALEEDIGSGDLTCQYFVPENATTKARIFARESGISAGLDVAAHVFHSVDATLAVHLERHDGIPFQPGDTLLQVAGRTASILSAERTALNFLQRLCAIATKTRACVEAIKDHAAQILDTRKTTPGWRWLEKHAVRCGGGTNHRMGLHDMVMVKDNHLLAETHHQALQQSINRLKAEHPHVRVEVEADTLDQLTRFLTLRGVDVILLDNMSPGQMRHAVNLTQGRVLLEASGGITPERLPEIAATGVDFISLGALTHAIRSLDLSLELVNG